MEEGDGFTPAFEEALTVLGALERRVDALRSGSRILMVDGTRAYAADADLTGIPFDPGTEILPGAGEPASVPTTASLVRLSKFSRPSAIRVRAFYLDQDPQLTVKVVAGNVLERRPIRRDSRARRRPERLRHLNPVPLIASGRGRQHGYLVERLVRGHHAGTREERQRTAEHLVRSVLSSQGTWVPGTLHTHRRTRERIQRLFERSEAPLRVSPSRLEEMAGAMSRTGMAAGWCHGDLVPSNVVIDDGAMWTVDFEHAGRMPVACDLVKVLGKVPDWRSLLEDVVAADPLRMRGVDTRTQLAMVVLRELSWWEHRERRAAAADRLVHHRFWLDRSLDMLTELV